MGKTCPNCGAEVSLNDKFCDECGLKIPSEEEEQKLRKEKIAKIAQEKEKSKAFLKRLLIALLILGIAAAVVFVPTKTKTYTVQVPYTTTETYETEEPYEVQVPYQDQEAYIDYIITYTMQAVKKDDCDKDSGCSCTKRGWLGLGDTCVECNCSVGVSTPVTRYREVTRYRTETRYKTVTKTREVTKIREEVKSEKVNWLFG